MAAREDRTAQIERVLHIARRVVRRHVERLEVVVVVLELRTVDDLVAHPEEDALDALADAREGMTPAHGRFAAWERHVDCVDRRPGGLECRQAFRDRDLNVLFELVGESAESRPLVG
jgi:hypothetical protein